MTKKLTKKQVTELTKMSAETQPGEKKVKDFFLNKTTDKDQEFYDEMKSLYEKYCDRDISFLFLYLLPEKLTPIINYRIADIGDQHNFQNRANIIFGKMYDFLCHSGFIKYLDANGYIKILDKGQHKTCGEIVKERIKDKEK